MQSILGKEINRIKLRYDVPRVGEIDILGHYSNDNYIFMAECKDRSIKYEDIDKWIANAKAIHIHGDKSLKYAFIVGSEGYTDGAIDRVRDQVDDKGGLGLGIGTKIVSYFTTDAGISDSGKIYLTMYDFRNGDFVKIFPEKRKKD